MYLCGAEFQKQRNTQVFIFADRAEDANAIVIAWRGTEPFAAMDWSTDFDFSWYHLEGMGNVHVGFLEALGLGSRNNLQSFQTMQQKCDDKCNNKRVSARTGIMSSAPQTLIPRILTPLHLFCSSNTARQRLVSTR